MPQMPRKLDDRLGGLQDSLPDHGGPREDGVARSRAGVDSHDDLPLVATPMERVTDRDPERSPISAFRYGQDPGMVDLLCFRGRREDNRRAGRDPLAREQADTVDTTLTQRRRNLPV